MPQRRSPHAFAILPITLMTSLSLITALTYLQLLYATSFILRLLQGPRRNPVPLRATIHQTERRTVDILFRIVPVPLYRSPPASGLLHEDPLGHRIVSAARSSKPVSHFRSSSHFSHASSEIDALDDRLQCYPSNAVERMRPQVKYAPVPPTTPAFDKPGQPNSNKNAHNITVTYEPIKLASKESRPYVPAMTNQQATPVQQVAQTDSAKHNQQSEETPVPEMGDVQSSEPVPDMPDTVQPVEKSPKVPFDERSECGMSTISTESMHSFSLPLTRSPKRCSTESYPGRFPLSDLHLSDAATASFSFFRERGTILVRPFSDF